MKYNGVSITGQEFIRVRDCNHRGQPVKYKKYQTHVLLRFSDKRWVRENNLMVFYENPVSKSTLKAFYELTNESK